MQNIANVRVGLAQIGASCAEIVRGCEQAQAQEFELDELDSMVVAFRELTAYAEKLRGNAMSSAIDPELDHDGDTQPANDLPEQVVCRCGHTRDKHMLPPFESCCVYCECGGFEP